MRGRTTAIGRWQLGVLTSLSQGSTVIPFLLFSGLAVKQPGTVNFFVPAVVVYTVQRACLVALRGFGSIENPYRIIKNGLWIAFGGAVLVLLSLLHTPLLFLGALLTGIGLCPFSSMYVPLRAELARNKAPFKRTGMIGSALYLLMVLLLMFFKKSAFPLVRIVFLLYTAAALYIVCRLDGDAFFSHAPAFDTGRRKPVYFLHAALLLLCLIVLRQYKFSGVSYLIYAAPAAVFISLIVEMARHLNYHDFVFETYWTGAVKSFLLIFSLVYHTSVGNSSMTALSYLALTLGGVLPAFILKPLKKAFPGKACARVCLLLCALFTFLLAAPAQALNFAGILLAAAFAGVASAEAGREYMQDERHELRERALVKNRISAVGGVASQMLLFITVFLLGKYHTHDNLLLAYTTGSPDPGIAPVLRTVCLICCALFLLTAALIARSSIREERAAGGR